MSATTCEATDEQRAKYACPCGTDACLADRLTRGGYKTDRQAIDCINAGYTREHERANNLSTELARAVSDVGVEYARAEMEHERAEGLAKELVALRAELADKTQESATHEAERKGHFEEWSLLFYDLLPKAQARAAAATARAAETQDRMVAAFGEGTTAEMLVAISHEHEAEVAELEKQLATMTSGLEETMTALSALRGQLAEKERQAATASMLKATCGPTERTEWERLVTDARNRSFTAEATLARLRAEPLYVAGRLDERQEVAAFVEKVWPPLAVEIRALPAPSAAPPRCCSSSHEPPDTACKVFLAGRNGRCTYCDHEAKCHPGPGATCEIGSGESAAPAEAQRDRLLLLKALISWRRLDKHRMGHVIRNSRDVPGQTRLRIFHPPHS